MSLRRAAIALLRTRTLSTTRVATTASPALDEKLRIELRELNESEPERWTATTLAARYGVARENVSAVLRLAQYRKTLPDKHITSGKALEDAWLALEPRERRLKPVRPPVPVAETADVETEVQQEVDDIDDDEDEDEDDDFVGTTETAQWARGKIEEGEFETCRKSTFAFIEVGKNTTDVSRAVWLRDGRTGKLRAPSKEERRRLLGQRRLVPE